jgi:hypothetical protein
MNAPSFRAEFSARTSAVVKLGENDLTFGEKTRGYELLDHPTIRQKIETAV